MVDKIGQLVIIGIRGTTLSPAEAEFIVKNEIGGVVLFARNVESPEQVHALCTALQALRHRTTHKLPLFIGIDQEGGRVARMRAPWTVWPPLAKVGELDSTSVAFKFAMGMGTELRAMGVNLDFAPSVDVLTNPQNTVIGDRSLSSDPERVARLASALVRGYIKSGVIPCAKHFPGHGNTLLDSHHDLPVEEADLARLREVELVPFKKVFRARLDLVMTSHIMFPKIDAGRPATLSSIFVRQILREELRYRGLVVTDDLDMKALASHYATEEIPVLALEAGCDILLYCNEFEHPAIALTAVTKAIQSGRLPAAQIEQSFEKISKLKREVLAEPDPRAFADAKTWVGYAEHRRLAEAITAGAVPADLLVTKE